MGEQDHNALDDAKLLKMVYDKMKSGERNFDAFLEYVDPHRYPDQVRKVLRLNGNTVLEEYNSLKEAVDWIKKQPSQMTAAFYLFSISFLVSISDFTTKSMSSLEWLAQTCVRIRALPFGTTG